jgi:hypothetical protein
MRVGPGVPSVGGLGALVGGVEEVGALEIVALVSVTDLKFLAHSAS